MKTRQMFTSLFALLQVEVVIFSDFSSSSDPNIPSHSLNVFRGTKVPKSSPAKHGETKKLILFQAVQGYPNLCEPSELLLR